MPKTRVRRQRRYSPSAVTHSNLRWLARPRIEIDRGLSWLVVWCRAQQERVAERDLREAGFATYRPTQRFERLYRGKTSTVEKAPVSRYLFVGINAGHPDPAYIPACVEAAMTEAGWWPRMSGMLLRIDGQPVRIGAGTLQRFEDAVNGSGGPAIGRGHFSVGHTARVISGPLCGLPIEISDLSDWRVRGLVDLLGGKVAVDLELEQLEAA